MQTQINLPRKERERLSRREEILTAARKVFCERGFEKATLDEIAVVAEFGKGTLYNYFKSKEDLFACIIETGTLQFQEFVAQATKSKSSPKEKIATYIDAAFEFFENNRQIYSIFVLEKNKLACSINDEMFSKCCAQQEAVKQFLAGLFQEGMTVGDFRRFEPLKLARALIGLLHTSMFQAIREPDTTNLKTEARFIKDILFEGIVKSNSRHRATT
ncbi:MAG: TetR/AcrR family transcriptional regulator [bacterium]